MLVSVVTPSLNGMEYLADCVASVQRQKSPRIDVEHIVVDGGSTDGTPEYARANGATVLTREEENISVAVTKGMRHASGTLIGVLACDDVLCDGALERLAAAHVDSGLPLVIGRCRHFDASGRSLGVQPVPPTVWPVPALASLHYSPVPAPATYYQRDFVRDLGWFDTDYHYAADFDLFLRARQRSPYARVHEPVAGARRHGANTSLQRTPTHHAELARIARTYGPAARWRREVYRAALRAWLNGAGPAWFMAKRRGALRARR